MHSLIRRFLPPVLWMALIYYLSAQSYLPSPAEPFANFVLKKLAHVFVYGVLYVLLYRAINGKKKKPNWLFPLIITIAYAFSDELHQMMTPGRTPTIRDIVFDTCGALIAMLKIHKRR